MRCGLKESGCIWWDNATFIVSVRFTDDYLNRDYFNVASCVEACANDAEHRQPDDFTFSLSRTQL